eukprot:TRINITY_DN3297_c3_g1_i1.p1 TRINITY_DN3297_c3_g1~~TRINITY_DN3297_c3_g1_i1.p1  ORF type:complete len:674 (+),score=231.11 TRINITY_DN3297_c3_g1_i1:57-2024(+)
MAAAPVAAAAPPRDAPEEAPAGCDLGADLQAAAAIGDPKGLAELLEAAPLDAPKLSALLSAVCAYETHTAAASELLRRGAAPCKAPPGTRPALHCVCDHAEGYGDLLRLLLSSESADVNAREAGNSGVTALHLACAKGNRALFDLLLAHPGIDVDAESDAGWRPLHVAASTNAAAMVERLHAAGADLERPNGRGSTPLHLACVSRALGAVRILLRRLASVQSRDGGGQTPLHILLRCRKEGAQAQLAELCDAMVELGADVKAADHGGRTPLHCALRGGHGRLSVLLLSHGADPAAADSQGITPVHLAAGCGDAGMVGILADALRKSAVLDEVDSKGRSPLFVAVAGGHVSCVKALLDKGCRVDIPDDSGLTPLLAALHCGGVQRRAAAELLVRRGANCAARDRKGREPLALAIKQGKDWAGLAQDILVRGKADVRASDSQGYTALHWAAESGDVRLLTALFEAGAEIAAVAGEQRQTALHVAAQQGQYNAVEVIYNQGRSEEGWVDVLDSDGRTALDLALASASEGAEYVRTAVFLARAGASLEGRLGGLPEDVREKVASAASQGAPDGERQFGDFGGFVASSSPVAAARAAAQRDDWRGQPRQQRRAALRHDGSTPPQPTAPDGAASSGRRVTQHTDPAALSAFRAFGSDAEDD